MPPSYHIVLANLLRQHQFEFSFTKWQSSARERFNSFSSLSIVFAARIPASSELCFSMSVMLWLSNLTSSLRVAISHSNLASSPIRRGSALLLSELSPAPFFMVFTQRGETTTRIPYRSSSRLQMNRMTTELVMISVLPTQKKKQEVSRGVVNSHTLFEDDSLIAIALLYRIDT